MSEIKKILVVSPDIPYPDNHGGRRDIWERIKLLNELGYTIDLIATTKFIPSDSEMNVMKKYIRKIKVLKRKNRLIDLISVYPYQVSNRKGLEKIEINEPYHFVILESVYVLSVLKNKKLDAHNILLRVHNIEYKYFYQLSKSEKNIFKKIYYFIETIKFYLVEHKSYKKIRNLMFVSKDEFDVINGLNSNLNSIFLPPSITNTRIDQIDMDLETQKTQTNNILFIGSLFMPNNIDGLIWYIKHVHPLIRDCHLIIAGNSREKSITQIEELIKKYNNITLIYNPTELKTLYESSTIFINPMRHGAGVKIKTIDAIVNGLPVVSTSVGAEGTGLENNKHIFISDSPKEFARNILTLLEREDLRKKIVNESSKYIKTVFDSKMILKKYLESFEKNIKPLL